MNRIIKFRGKTRCDNPKWVYGDLIQAGGGCFIRQHGNSGLIGEGVYVVDPETVGQYTGLNDSTGTEICEGDIVSTSHRNCQKAKIIFDRGCYRVDRDIRDYELKTLKLVYKAKVIGNIIDNPELMEDKE